MSNDLDLVIETLKSELNSRGINIRNNENNAIMNNYFDENKEKQKIINGGNINFNSDNNYNNISKINNYNYNYELNQMKKQIQNDLYQSILQLKMDMKRSIDNINNKMFNIENHLLKNNTLNDNLRDILIKLSKIENDFILLDKDLKSTSSITIRNNEDIENTKQFLKGISEENDKIINQLNNKVNNIINKHIIFESKYNEYY